jgi:predicted transcriptional regulator of viral defense system
MEKLLNWSNVQRGLAKYPIFSPLDMRREFGVSKRAVTLAINRYLRQGWIERLRRGCYAFPERQVPPAYIANRIYEPSYVSLESALSYHGVIPETVYTVTSVSTRATRRFQVRAMAYTYRRLTPKAYTGYRIVRQDGFSVAIADPEKAFVDLAYFRLRRGLKPTDRFRRTKLDRRTAVRFARLFGNAKLVRTVRETLR